MYEVRNAKFSTYNPPKTSVRRRISRRSQSFQLKVSSHPRYGCIFTLPIHFQNLQTCNMVRWAHVSDTLTRNWCDCHKDGSWNPRVFAHLSGQIFADIQTCPNLNAVYRLAKAGFTMGKYPPIPWPILELRIRAINKAYSLHPFHPQKSEHCDDLENF